ncbi:MAG: sulfite exporter TauE/SafE family protein, partial [Alphaproteobacteria bacterium]|nr:sulfite exporter TauE/SafE family protein [Alphaproteobacteria bacterium]
NKSTLTTSAILFPISLIFTFIGIWVVKKLPTKIFYEIIYILLFLVSIKLIYDGFTKIIY